MKPLFALDERSLSPIETIEIEQVERVIDELRLAAGLAGVLQSLEAADAAGQQGDELTVEDGRFNRQRDSGIRNPPIAVRPVELIARDEFGFAVIHAAQQPVAVELDLMQPLGAGGDFAGERRELEAELGGEGRFDDGGWGLRRSVIRGSVAYASG